MSSRVETKRFTPRDFVGEPYRYVCVHCGSTTVRVVGDRGNIDQFNKFKCDNRHCSKTSKEVYDKKKGHNIRIA